MNKTISENTLRTIEHMHFVCNESHIYVKNKTREKICICIMQSSASSSADVQLTESTICACHSFVVPTVVNKYRSFLFIFIAETGRTWVLHRARALFDFNAFSLSLARCYHCLCILHGCFFFFLFYTRNSLFIGSLQYTKQVSCVCVCVYVMWMCASAMHSIWELGLTMDPIIRNKWAYGLNAFGENCNFEWFLPEPGHNSFPHRIHGPCASTLPRLHNIFCCNRMKLKHIRRSRVKR